MAKTKKSATFQDRLWELIEEELKSRSADVIEGAVRSLRGRLGQKRQAPEPAAPSAGYPPATLAAYQVLGATPDTPLSRIEELFRQKLLQCHPDRGGTKEETQRLVEAMRQIRAERGR